MKPGTPALRSIRLLDQVRERIRYLHYSLQTEKAYLYWVRFFIRWHGQGGTMRHPRDMGAAEVEAFLTMLATERHVSASTHNQALSALLFLYREVLGVDLPWLDGVNRPTQKRRIPSFRPAGHRSTRGQGRQRPGGDAAAVIGTRPSDAVAACPPPCGTPTSGRSAAVWKRRMRWK